MRTSWPGSDYALHYYRLDGILLGSVEPIHGLTEEPAVDIPAHTMALQKSSVINGTADADTVTLNEGGELLTEAWMLFPGSYRVTLTGSGFDHSYIYARHGLINQDTYKMEVNFTGIAPDEMVFEFSPGEPLYYWRTARPRAGRYAHHRYGYQGRKSRLIVCFIATLPISGGGHPILPGERPRKVGCIAEPAPCGDLQHGVPGCPAAG